MNDRNGFSGVIRVDVRGERVREDAHGLAERRLGVPNTPLTRFGMASGCKGFTALATMALVERGVISLDTTARSLLGDDLPLIDDDVTVEHLLSHRSGIGDYLDEEALGAITDYAMTVPVHTLATTDGFLPMLIGHPQKTPPGEVFAYNNGGFVVLALLIERAAGRGFHDVVEELVIRPAGLGSTAYLRTDELPADAAVGYLFEDGLRTNALHLPVRGNGDGGAYTTAADMRTFWSALFAGRVVGESSLAQMIRPRDTNTQLRYGLGFWLGRDGDAAVVLEGYDAGVSFRSIHDPTSDSTWTVISNWSDGAWPIAREFLASRPTQF